MFELEFALEYDELSQDALKDNFRKEEKNDQ